MIADDQIKTALREIIVGVQPKAIVWPFWVQAVDDGKWGALLKSPDDDDKINAWVISCAADETTDADDSTADRELTYRVWHFLQYEVGTVEANTERVFSDNREIVWRALHEKPDLGFASVPGHGQLQFRSINVLAFGDRQAHVAQGELVVRIVDADSPFLPLETL